MSVTYHPVAARTGGHLIYELFAPFPFVCFTLALLTDLFYWQTSYLMWQHFSEWLLLAGLVFGGIAALAVLVRLVMQRGYRPGWGFIIGGIVVLLLAFVNSLIHSGDGWTAVVPYGLLLSLATVIAMAVTAWLSRPYVVLHDARGDIA
jgi:uncharacterized membrane protein